METRGSSEGRLALIGGHAIAGSEAAIAAGGGPVTVETEHGAVELIDSEELVLLQRHGERTYVSAHAIDHRANVSALAELGCTRALAICSVGSLRRDLPVGTFICPDDFVALHLGLSFGTGSEGELVPLVDSAWRRRVVEIWRERSGLPLVDGGTYWQAIGPRFETPAEIRLIATHADVVGMTMAAELILAAELGIDYAAVCVVDNLANGIGDCGLTVEEFEQGKAENRAALLAAIEAVAPAIAPPAADEPETGR